MISHSFVFLTLFASLTISGCAGRAPLKATSDLAVVDSLSLPPPDAGDLLTGRRTYLIGAFDKVSVEVFGVPELSRQVQADANGRIALPLIGSLDVVGTTPEDLGTRIAGLLRGRYVRNPQVTVNLIETVSQVVTVDGQVQEPGLYPVLGRMTLMRAVATAKGLSEFAKLNDVVVFRSVKGQRMAALYDLAAIRRGAYGDPEIFANDVIIVGDSPARRLFKDFVSVTPLLAAPIIALVQSRN